MVVVRSIFLALLGCAIQTSLATGAEPAVESKEKVSYYRDVRPIFQQHCQGCHQPAKAKGGYVMTSHEAVLKLGDSEEPNVVPGKPEESQLFEQIISQGGKPPIMPKGADPLKEAQVALVKRWIAEGAADDTPATARQTVDADHPPKYVLPPVITSLSYSPDGQLLAVSGYHEIFLYKPDGSKLVARLVGMSERIQSLAFSPDGKLLAVSGGCPGRFGEIQIWNVADKKLVLSCPVTFDTLYGVSWSHDSARVAFGCADNTLRAIEASTGKQILYQGAHSDWVLDTIFSSDSSHLITVSRDRSMKLTEVGTQRFVDNITSITPGALKGGLMTLDRHPKLDEVVVGGSDGVPKLYRVYREKGKERKIGDDFNKIRDFPTMPGRVFAVRFSPDGSMVLAGSSKDSTGEAQVFQTADAKLVSKLEGEKGAVFAVAWRPDSKEVASAGFDGIVRLNDPKTGKLTKEFVPAPVQSSKAP